MNPESKPEFPWATITAVGLTLIVGLTGAIVVIWGDPGALSFEDYMSNMTKFVGGIGLLAIGRGIRSGMKSK
jgi:hypothetical protein